MKSVSIDRLVDDLKLQIIYKSKNSDIKITNSDLNRPGLQLTGYFDYFPFKRIQLIGRVEWTYLSTLDEYTKDKRLEKLFQYDTPAIIITRNLKIYPQMLKYAEKYDRTLLRTDIGTTKFITKVMNYLDDMMAPETTIHGVLLEVCGMGVLIIGKSGVGKSETALELIKRGHRLVADDAVQIKIVDEVKLKGTSPELIRHFLEIRGIGVIDIKRLFGVGAVKKYENIDIVVELELWDERKQYDRLGLDEQYIDILGINVPKYVVPVRSGRNLAMIVEVAARNNREKQLGYNAAHKLNNNIINKMNK